MMGQCLQIRSVKYEELDFKLRHFFVTTRGEFKNKIKLNLFPFLNFANNQINKVELNQKIIYSFFLI